MTSDVLARLIARSLISLTDLLFPPRCVSCGANGAWLCAACLQKTRWILPPYCPRCGLPLAHGKSCACTGKASNLTLWRSAAWHVPPLQDAVHAVKYEGVRVLAEPLGEVLATCYRQAQLQPDIIVPVPLHRERQRERGYNQSELLARALSKRVQVQVRTDILARAVRTRSQVGLSAEERQANVAGAFICRGDAAEGRSILLIDDVMTTGATLESCAQALLSSGATRVSALTLTRAT